MAPTALIAGLDHGRKLSRHSVRRSSKYREKRDALPRTSTCKLNILEARLFERYASQSSDGANCEACLLPRPETVFDCPEGRIYLFYSKTRRQYFLTDFELCGDGTGGLFSASSSECEAKAASLHRSASGYRRVACLPSAATSGMHFAGVRSMWAALARDPRHEGPGEGRFDAHRLRGFASELEDLADWSLLKRFVSVPEQLASPFARAILAGEIVCRIGEQVSFHVRGSFALGREPFCRDADLLLESAVFLHAFEGLQARRPDIDLKCFVTSALVDGDCLGDDRRLGLIKSEFILRMSHSVSRRVASFDAWHPTSFSCGDHRLLIRKLSLLSDFVCDCHSFFGASVLDEIDVEDVMRGTVLPVDDDRSDVKDFISNLNSFGRLADAVVGELATDREHRGDLMDRLELQERMISIAAEILDLGR